MWCVAWLVQVREVNIQVRYVSSVAISHVVLFALCILLTDGPTDLADVA